MEQAINNVSKKKQRNSGIELLRLIAGIMVILVHIATASERVVESGSVAFYLIQLLTAITIPAVNIFVIVSAFFLVKSQKRSWVKVIELVFMVIFFEFILNLLDIVVLDKPLTLKKVAEALLPNNYFVVLYTCMFILSPFVNFLLKKLSQQQLVTLIIILVAMFSVWNFGIDLMREIANKDLNQLSTVGSWGSQKGFTIVNFLLIYVIGAYFGLHGFPKLLTSTKFLIFSYLLALIITFSSCFIKVLVYTNRESAGFGYHSPFVIYMAVALLCLFAKLNFSNKIINSFAGASFISFLIHQRLFSYFGVERLFSIHWALLFPTFFAIAVGLYVIAFCVYLLYNISIKKLFTKLDKVFENKGWILNVELEKPQEMPLVEEQSEEKREDV